MSKDHAGSVPPREDSMRTSLSGLRDIEKRRLQEEEAAEERLRLDAEARRKVDEEKRREEDERQRQEAEAAVHAQKEAAERERLLNVDRRIAERVRELREEFALERVRIREEALSLTKTRPRTTAILITVVALLVMCFAAIIAFRESARHRETERRLEEATNRATRYQNDLKGNRVARAVTMELYQRTVAESGRCEQALEAVRAQTGDVRIVPRPAVVHKPASKAAPLALPPSFRRKGSINLDTTEDPIGGIQ